MFLLKNYDLPKHAKFFLVAGKGSVFKQRRRGFNIMKAYIGDEVPIDLHPRRKSRRDIIQDYVTDAKRECKDEHFIVCDVGDIIEKYQQWMRLLPRVKLFYAVKCCMDKSLLQIMSDLGASFDCASKMEIEKVLELGVSPDRVAFTHPYKPGSSLIYAERNSVSLLTFDSETELRKIKSHHPAARLILRIQQFIAKHTFGSKFGCPSSQTRDLLQLAQELELSVVGVSFHLGTAISDPCAYTTALKESRNVIEIAREIGFNISILNIGGGFPGAQNTSEFFREITNVVNETLDDLFPPEDGMNIIAEPGRYVMSSAYTVVANIIGKRCCPRKRKDVDRGAKFGQKSIEDGGNTLMYYVNDSIFGNFLIGRLYDPGCVTYVPKLLKSVDENVSKESILWGFTCTGKDCINPSINLPELDVGDWLYFEDMGAYTNNLSSNFNGLETPEIKYYCSKDLWFQAYPNRTEQDNA